MITPKVRVGQIWKWTFGDIYLIAGLKSKRGRAPDVALCVELNSGYIYYFTSVGQARWELFIDV